MGLFFHDVYDDEDVREGIVNSYNFIKFSRPHWDDWRIKDQFWIWFQKYDLEDMVLVCNNRFPSKHEARIINFQYYSEVLKEEANNQRMNKRDTIDKKIRRWNTVRSTHMLNVLVSDNPDEIRTSMFRLPVQVRRYPQIAEFRKPIDADDFKFLPSDNWMKMSKKRDAESLTFIPLKLT
jgi:hypothetical protein